MAGSEGRKQNQLTVGVLLFPTVQFLDVSAVDLFCMFDPSYLGVGLPAHIVSLGTPVKVKYIAASGKGSLISTTAGASIEVTDSLVDESVKPGNLDILVIPGPEPSYQLADPEKVFIQAHAKVERSVIMTVCSGILAAVQAGILDGRQATGPRALLSQLALQCPKAKWVDKRWTCDIAKEGERRPDIWSSGALIALQHASVLIDLFHRRYHQWSRHGSGIR